MRATNAIGRAELAMFVGIAAVMFGALMWTPGSRFVEDAANEIRLMIQGAEYVGYYVDLDARDANGVNAPRLMFAPGKLPGIAAVPNVAQQFTAAMGHGGWSSDREHVFVVSAAKMYVGDRRGQLREVADLGAGLQFWRAGWVGTNEIMAVVAPTDWMSDARRWITRVGMTTGAGVLRPLPESGARLLRDPDIREGHVSVSPGGRWIRYGSSQIDGCPQRSSLYDLESDRSIDLVDARGRRLMAIGWFSDGRLVTGFCDPQGTIDVFVDAPDRVPSVPLATLPWRPLSVIPVVDPPRDRILFAPGGGSSRATLTAIEPNGGRTELGRIPAFTSSVDERAFIWTLSRDGRYLSFVTSGQAVPGVGLQVLQRVGVVELATGQVTYACPPGPRGCGNLTLR